MASITQPQTCDVCIVGAGVAGLNALFVASQYLRRDQRIILVDRRKRVGGMWVDTYDYVRLHQPHPLFTAGNIKWTLDKPREYLAAKPEILDHFQRCLDIIKRRVQIDERFGWSYQSHEEVHGKVVVTLHSPASQTHVIETAKLIKASGFDIVSNDPLPVSSSRVQSVSPNFCDMRGEQMRSSDSPVWVIGGGKTAMDTTYTLITEYPDREINLVAGGGTFFFSRDRIFPMGWRRWLGGVRTNLVMVETARRFDGTNEVDVSQWYRDKVGLWVTPDVNNFAAGVLSEVEARKIKSGLKEIIVDRFIDAADHNGSVDLLLGSGARKTLAPGSWLVNCTGYLIRGKHPYEPYVSTSGNVLSINTRSMTFAFTSFAGYFLTHLMFLGALSAVPLFALDGEEARGKGVRGDAITFAAITATQYNLSLVFDAVPSKVFQNCGLDFDRWYPFPRRMAGVAGFMTTHRKDRDGYGKALNAFQKRFNLSSGPITGSQAHLR